MSDLLNLSVADGKYTVVIHGDYSAEALRNGEPWQDLTGNKFVLALACELAEAREKLRISEGSTPC